jgi:hypothetical protein
MRYSISRAALVLALMLSSVLAVAGCGDSGSADPGGSGGSRGTAGTDGGASPIPLEVPQCVSSAYQMVFRGIVEPLDPLLRYMDTPARIRPPSPTIPQIARFTQDTDVPPVTEPEHVLDVYMRFTWDANDVDGISDPVEHTLITVDFSEAGSVDLDLGIVDSEVVHVPWKMTVGTSTVVGAGKMSVVGLGDDTVKVSILPTRSDHRPVRDTTVLGPWYEGWANVCLFEVKSFNLHLDLATPGSEPFAVVVGFEATGKDFAIENGWFIFGEDDTVNFTGEYGLGSAQAIPFDLTLDYGTDPAGISGTFGELPVGCTIDLATFDTSCRLITGG